MSGIWRKLRNVAMRGLGYEPNEKAVRAEELFVDEVVKYLELMGSTLGLAWRRIPVDSATPLVGYVYGLCKALAIAAEEKDPEVFFYGAWRVLYRAYPGRKDFEAILQRCEFDAPDFVEGREFGFADAALILSGSSPVSRFTALLAHHCPQCIGNELILERVLEAESPGTLRAAGPEVPGRRQ